MTQSRRILLAALILICDVLVFIVPVAGLFACYVVLARPPWFLEWMKGLYEGT